MKEKLSKALLEKFMKKTPPFVINVQCQILLNLMASSCGVPSERVLFLSKEKALEAYVHFTLKCIREGKADSQKLFDSALQTGRKIARISGLKKETDRQQLIFLLYRNIHITMNGTLPGEIRIPHCYFADYYTPEQCRIMSDVDAGIIAGIMGSGTLCFHQRLSEGCEACIASFRKEDAYE